MSMLRTCQANTSPVLAMFEDQKKIISKSIKAQTNKAQTNGSPIIAFTDPWGDNHKIWAIRNGMLYYQFNKKY